MKSLIRTHKGRRCEVVYVLATTDEFELPLVVSNDMRDIAKFLEVGTHYCYRCFEKQNTIGRRYKIERIFLPMERRRGCYELY